MSQPRYKRRRKIVPGFQFRLVLTFLGFCTLSLSAQSLLVGHTLATFAERMPTGSEHMMAEMPALLTRIFVVSLGVLLPPIFIIGVLSTFRIAGPIHRFKLYLAQVASGEDVGPCRIRTEDQMHDLCDLINEALEEARAKARAEGAAEAAAALEPTHRDAA